MKTNDNPTVHENGSVEKSLNHLSWTQARKNTASRVEAKLVPPKKDYNNNRGIFARTKTDDHRTTIENDSVTKNDSVRKDPIQPSRNGHKFTFSRQLFGGCVAILDLLSLSAPAVVIYMLYVGPTMADPIPYLAAIALLTACTVLLLASNELYELNRITRPFRHLPRVIGLVSFSFLALVTLGFLLKLSSDFSRVWIASWAISSIALVSLFRILVPKIMRNLARKGQLTRNIMVYGAGLQGAKLVHRIQQSREPWTNVIGVFDERSTRTTDELEGFTVRTGIKEMIGFGREQHADEVVIALPWSAENRILEVIRDLSVLPAQISLCPELTRGELLRPEVWIGSGVDHDMPVLPVLEKPVDGWSAIGKQAFDLFFGGLLTLAALPVMAAIALLIKLDSRGPILFKQERFGFNNQLIGVYKFRTMYVDQSDHAADKLTQKNDPRVTRVGAFLRRWSLDELPQLFNVLEGGMSIVGPRPHAVNAKAGGTLYGDVIAEYAVRHKVKPGITGWAQVNGWRGNTETEQDLLGRVQHDLYYIEHWSILLDAIIVARTAWAVIKGENSY
jgi:Undecaprenyl-phosphate glucose phosphotransferase